MMVFRKPYHFSDVLAVLRGTIERATGWIDRLFLCHLGFAMTHDSIRLEAVVRAVATRGVPEPISVEFLWDHLSSEFTFFC